MNRRTRRCLFALLCAAAPIGAPPVGGVPVPPAPAPARAANLVYNSSFELGVDGWSVPEQIALIEGESPDGRRFARWLPGEAPLEAQPFAVRRGQLYTVSAWLRSQRPGARVRLSLLEWGGAVEAAESFDLTPDWRRYSFSVRLPGERDERYLLVVAPAGAAHTLDVDAVQVAEGPLAPYAPAAPVEVCPGLTRAQRFPLPDEAILVPARLYAPGKLPATAQLRCRIEGYSGETLAAGTAPVPAGATHAEAPLRIRVPGFGIRRLVVEALVGGEPVSRAEAILTALPAPAPAPEGGPDAPEGFFGAQGSPGAEGDWHAATVAARAGIRWWRLDDGAGFTRWDRTEPQPGRFVWFEREVEGLRARGFALLAVLAGTPAWAGRDPSGAGYPSGRDPSAWPPARLETFAAWAGRVAGHYRGRIAAYELWRRPWDRAAWSGTPEEYAALVRVGARAVRAADPGARLLAGGFSAEEPRFTDRVLAPGLPKPGSPGFLTSVDAVSCSLRVADAARAGEATAEALRALRGKLELAASARPAGAAQGAIPPLWVVEGGVPDPGLAAWRGAADASRAAARSFAQMLLLCRAAGVRRFFCASVWEARGPRRSFHAAFRTADANDFSLLDYDGSGKPVLAVLAACARFLDGTEPAGRVETDAVRAFLFQREGETVVAAWRVDGAPGPDGGPLRLRLPGPEVALSAFDLMGNPVEVSADNGESAVRLEAEPLYLRLRAARPSEVAAALRAALGVSEEREKP